MYIIDVADLFSDLLIKPNYTYSCMEKESNNYSDPDPLTLNHNSDNTESLPKPNNDHHDEPNQKDVSYDQDEPTPETPLKKTPTSSLKHLTTLKVLKKPSLRGLKAPQSPWRYAISRTRASKTTTGNGQLFKKASSENLSMNNLVQINVAGLKFKTKRSTLRRFPNTLLGSVILSCHRSPLILTIDISSGNCPIPSVS